MSSNKKGKGVSALRERREVKNTKETTRDSPGQLIGSVQHLGEVVPRKARKANKKLAKSVRKHPTGWGSAVAGVVAAAVGAVIGAAALRKRC